MTQDLWDKPVELMIGTSDHFHSVSNTREAVACLGTCWPSEHDASYAKARRICLKAATGKASSAAAHAAFLQAAKEAGILRH
jgi:hypothetical protein